MGFGQLEMWSKRENPMRAGCNKQRPRDGREAHRIGREVCRGTGMHGAGIMTGPTVSGV